MIAPLVRALLDELKRQKEARVSDLADLAAHDAGIATGRSAPARRQQAVRILNRLLAAGVVAAEERSSGRYFRIADESRLDRFVYGYTTADGRDRPDLRRQAARAHRARGTVPPLVVGCQPGDVVTSMGQPFVCTGAQYVVTIKKGRKMPVSVWRSVCAFPGCCAGFDQTFPLRFPFRTTTAPIRTCPEHRRMPIEDLTNQFTRETVRVDVKKDDRVHSEKSIVVELRPFEKFKEFKETYADLYSPI